MNEKGTRDGGNRPGVWSNYGGSSTWLMVSALKEISVSMIV